MQNSHNEELDHLEHLRRGRVIDKSTYQRLKQVINLTQEQKRVDLIETTLKKTSKCKESFVGFDTQPVKDDQSLELNSTSL